MISYDAEIHRMQKAFRTAMDAFAHPGKVVRLGDMPKETCGLSAPLATLTRMFVDQAVTFFCFDEEISSKVAVETKAKAVSLEDALFVVVPFGAQAAGSVAGANAGTLVSPEKGATVLYECGRVALGPAEGLVGFEVEGPGVKDVNRFWADSAIWAEERNGRGDEYPLGIEIMLVDGEGNLAVVPRSCRVTCMEGGR